MLSTANSIYEDAKLRLGWHALYTRHQHEKAVAAVLRQKGLEVFLPLYATAHRWKDRTKQLALPLFPCYVFVRGGLDCRQAVLTTPGVFSFVGCAGRPEEIPEADMEAIFRILRSTLQVEPHPFLRCGDQVRVNSGPLEGIEGILVRKKGLFCLVLSVEMLQKAVAVEVDASTVERITTQKVRRGPVPRLIDEVWGDRHCQLAGPATSRTLDRTGASLTLGQVAYREAASNATAVLMK
jgi:transcription antitermination factor NusG